MISGPLKQPVPLQFEAVIETENSRWHHLISVMGKRLHVSVLLLLALSIGCRSVPTVKAPDLGEKDWAVRQGQALWHFGEPQPPLAGELVVATRPNQECYVEFGKTPLRLVEASVSPTAWCVKALGQNRTARGFGQPPSRFIWLQLACHWAGLPLADDFRFERTEDQHWQFRNLASGEWLEGYLNP